jgi:polysaccharide export outer membrane protein
MIGVVGGQAAEAEYFIGSGDVLQIVVWKHADLSGTIPVRPDGKISVPLLDDVQAAGRTAVELKNVIASGMRKYLDTPVVTVIVSEVNAYRVTVFGEVKRPGTYVLKGRMTIVDVLSLSGGFTEFASTKDILLVSEKDSKNRRGQSKVAAATCGESVHVEGSNKKPSSFRIVTRSSIQEEQGNDLERSRPAPKGKSFSAEGANKIAPASQMAKQRGRCTFNYNRFVSGDEVEQNIVLDSGDTLIIR